MPGKDDPIDIGVYGEMVNAGWRLIDGRWASPDDMKEMINTRTPCNKEHVTEEMKKIVEAVGRHMVIYGVSVEGIKVDKKKWDELWESANPKSSSEREQ